MRCNKLHLGVHSVSYSRITNIEYTPHTILLLIYLISISIYFYPEIINLHLISIPINLRYHIHNHPMTNSWRPSTGFWHNGHAFKPPPVHFVHNKCPHGTNTWFLGLFLSI